MNDDIDFIKRRIQRENLDIADGLCDDDFKNHYESILKKLKALEIIKLKCVDIMELKIAFILDNMAGCNLFNWSKNAILRLTQEEFDLLKEVLEND